LDAKMGLSQGVRNRVLNRAPGGERKSAMLMKSAT
jgi:hypothetical protein